MSIVTAILSIAAIYSAWDAMRRGLTQTALAATMWALSFIAVARVFHTVRELFAWPENTEQIEYALYILAYIIFIELILRTRQAPKPSAIRKKHFDHREDEK